MDEIKDPAAPDRRSPLTVSPDAPLPAGEQCPATAKSTQQRCRNLVIGGGPCRLHGGAARQVAAKREQRIAVWQAQAAGQPVEMRTSAAALVSAARDADEIVQRLRIAMAAKGGMPDMATLDAFGAWLDRVSRLAKAVLDSGAEKQKAQLAEHQGEVIANVIRAILNAMLDKSMRLLADVEPWAAEQLRARWPAWVAEVVPRELMRVAEQQAGADGG
ncbi:hypothetical protein ACI2LC_17630 [Nonomuraea wenchangensis]|uniref:hypothetical protein n=1 Tax=Nonomuraea wenchangensis TaxID=568860 RepID=UPI00384DB300